jgi:hypothetical protein
VTGTIDHMTFGDLLQTVDHNRSYEKRRKGRTPGYP